MILEILTPERRLYSGDVYGVQLPGIDGKFEVLNRHAPLVSALGKGNIKVIRDKNTISNFSIESGFVEVLNNKATVLVEGATELQSEEIVLRNPSNSFEGFFYLRNFDSRNAKMQKLFCFFPNPPDFMATSSFIFFILNKLSIIKKYNQKFKNQCFIVATSKAFLKQTAL